MRFQNEKRHSFGQPDIRFYTVRVSASEMKNPRDLSLRGF
jgi:hypothetical protein